MLWGYGERPGRVFAFALTLIGVFAIVYFVGHDRLANFPNSARALNALYFSVVTFTTLGYGDILPADNGMKLVCALEAITGAFTMGMVVAGFANRSRY
jgi:voltage-gated potassium channel Kch